MSQPSTDLHLAYDLHDVVFDDLGRTLGVRVLGALRSDGEWDGFVEFTDGDQILLTPPETTQRSLPELAQWAAGLTPIYLAGALAQAKEASGLRGVS